MIFFNKIKKSGLKFLFWEAFWLLKLLTLKKLVNLLKIFFQEKFTRPAKVDGFPIKLTIDPSANCVLRCPLCPTGQTDKGRKRGEMGFPEFKKLINEVGQYLLEIDLFNWGEPFLNRDIFKIISLCYERKIITRLSSNLNYFPKGYGKKVVESKLCHLVVSLDGVTQETYGKYRVGGSIKKVLETIEMINDEKEREHSSFPFLTWQFIVFEHNKHEMERARKLVKKWGFDRIVFIENRGDMGKELFEKDKKKNTTCNFLWNQSVVNWNGSVSPCCLYYDEKYDFGNAFKEGFSTIWNNEKYQKARKLIKSKKITDKIDNNIICASCVKNGFSN